MGDGSDKERVELKGQTRHAHLDMDGMEIDAEPETLVACGEVVKEADTHMRDGDETS